MDAQSHVRHCVASFKKRTCIHELNLENKKPHGFFPVSPLSCHCCTYKTMSFAKAQVIRNNLDVPAYMKTGFMYSGEPCIKQL